MTESDLESASIPQRPSMNDLPPVQPPSAGFIVQLFIFPALIVMGVVAIWWMFGLIAVGEQVWRKLLQDLQSQNLHVRNRAMYGLAQVLDQDSRRGEQGQNLRANREIAQGLADQLIIELKRNSTSREGVAIQEYLTRALGMMDSLDAITPAIKMALEPQRDVEIRKSAVVSLSFVAGRANERGEPLSDPDIVASLIEMSGESAPILRQTAAFALGLFKSPDATHQLEVLLESGDKLTGINSALGLARQGNTRGYTILKDALAEPTIASDPQKPDASGEQFRIVKNVLKGVTDLASKFEANQKQELIPLVEQLSSNHPEIRIRVDAEAALNALKSAVGSQPSP